MVTHQDVDDLFQSTELERDEGNRLCMLLSDVYEHAEAYARILVVGVHRSEEYDHGPDEARCWLFAAISRLPEGRARDTADLYANLGKEAAENGDLGTAIIHLRTAVLWAGCAVEQATEEDRAERTARTEVVHYRPETDRLIIHLRPSP